MEIEIIMGKWSKDKVTKCHLVVVKPKKLTKKDLVKLDKIYLQSFTYTPPLLSKSEQEINEKRLNEVSDTIWKLRYIKGEVSLYQYLIKEAERLQGIV